MSSAPSGVKGSSTTSPALSSSIATLVSRLLQRLWSAYQGDRSRSLRASGGADAAYRSVMVGFPAERLSVILLANAADLDAAGPASRAADIFLERRIERDANAPSANTPNAPKEVNVDVTLLASYTGEFR